MTTKLSVLDQTPVIHGHSTADAIAATLDLARLADDLGYTRYWCAEHHGLRGVSNPCPEVLLARIGSITKRIRIGSGGVMLPYYSSFKVAEQFLTEHVEAKRSASSAKSALVADLKSPVD